MGARMDMGIIAWHEQDLGMPLDQDYCGAPEYCASSSLAWWGGLVWKKSGTPVGKGWLSELEVLERDWILS